jgi:hypothetical protein
MVEDHTACAEIPEQSFEDLLLDEVTPVFTDKDISMFLTPPSKLDV